MVCRNARVLSHIEVDKWQGYTVVCIKPGNFHKDLWRWAWAQGRGENSPTSAQGARQKFKSIKIATEKEDGEIIFAFALSTRVIEVPRPQKGETITRDIELAAPTMRKARPPSKHSSSESLPGWWKWYWAEILERFASSFGQPEDIHFAYLPMASVDPNASSSILIVEIRHRPPATNTACWLQPVEGIIRGRKVVALLVTAYLEISEFPQQIDVRQLKAFGTTLWPATGGTKVVLEEGRPASIFHVS